MGYYADSLEIDFSIPADKVEAALAAVNAINLGNYRPEDQKPYSSLEEAVRDLTTFEGSSESDEGFTLGWSHDKYLSYTDDVLMALAPFAKEGSIVRLIGEDHALFGFKVADGKLIEQYGEIVWH